jgi:hypothetical protein
MTPAQPALDAMMEGRADAYLAALLGYSEAFFAAHKSNGPMSAVDIVETMKHIESAARGLHAIVPTLAAEVRAQRETIAGLTAENARLRVALAAMANTVNIVGSDYDQAIKAIDGMVAPIKRQARLALSGDTNNAVSLALPDAVRDKADDLEGNAGDTPNG